MHIVTFLAILTVVKFGMIIRFLFCFGSLTIVQVKDELRKNMLLVVCFFSIYKMFFIHS